MLIRNLLSTIAFTIYCCETSSGTEPRTRDFLTNFGMSNEHANQKELTSSEIYGAGSLWPRSYHNNPHSNIEPLIIHYKGRDIQVSFHIKRGHSTPADCRVLGPHHGVPTIKVKEHVNYITRALMHGGKRYCVVYETGNGDILGAKLPPILGSFAYTGDPNDLNPDEMKCYITYGGLDFVVNASPETRKPLNMKLLPRNITPNQSFLYRYAFNTIPVYFGGLYFLLYQGTLLNDQRQIKIVGADLDPNWLEKFRQTHYG